MKPLFFLICLLLVVAPPVEGAGETAPKTESKKSQAIRRVKAVLVKVVQERRRLEAEYRRLSAVHAPNPRCVQALEQVGKDLKEVGLIHRRMEQLLERLEPSKKKRPPSAKQPVKSAAPTIPQASG